VPSGYTGKPLLKHPQAIPGIIQAESYDTVVGGNSKDVTVGYKGELRQSDHRPFPDSAGVAGYGEGHVSVKGETQSPDQVYLGWTETGQWMAYTVQVKEAGTYVFGGKFAAAGKDGAISVSFTPEITTGPIPVPTTEGYQPGVEVYHVWETLENLKEITLPAGVYVMKVKIEKNAGINLDYFSFTKKT
jgi:hypothetical protein